MDRPLAAVTLWGKRVLRPLKRIVYHARVEFHRRFRSPVGKCSTPRLQAKREEEFGYWEGRVAQEGTLGNSHYEPYYTTCFGLDRSFYRGKAVLDIGCGPRGSLEWADEARERVGLDPLVYAYRKLGIDRHQMKYVEGGSEKIPFPDGYFDVVASINSFDHVDDLDRTIAEVIRVTAVGGLFLLTAEVHPHPSVTEPITLPWDVTSKFLPRMVVESETHYERENVAAPERKMDWGDYVRGIWIAPHVEPRLPSSRRGNSTRDGGKAGVRRAGTGRAGCPPGRPTSRSQATSAGTYFSASRCQNVGEYDSRPLPHVTSRSRAGRGRRCQAARGPELTTSLWSRAYPTGSSLVYRRGSASRRESQKTFPNAGEGNPCRKRPAPAPGRRGLELG
jgi:SAM-dependent methyltransferase